MSMLERGIIALDGMDFLAAIRLAEKLHGKVWGFKVNDLLDGEIAPELLISSLVCHGRVFVDIKAHDIPNTVANRVKKLAKNGAHLISAHASGGVPMMQAAVNAFEEHKSSPHALGILAITVLTSLDDDACYATYGAIKSLEAVSRFAGWAEKAGAYGIVCSPKELLGLQGKYPTLKRVTPGVRSPGKAVHDQVRIDTPRNAVQNGADFLVIGRQVTEDPDPERAVAEIDAELAEVA